MSQEIENQQLAFAAELYQKGNVHEAIAFLNNAILQHPNFLEAYFYLGCFYQSLNQLHDAQQHYEKVLHANPHHFDALINMGNVLITQQQLYKALTYYDKALALQPDDTDLLSNRGHLLSSLKRYDDALESLNQALTTNPNHISALNNKGFLLCELERYEEALISFNNVLKINPQNMTALCNRYSVFHRLKRSAEALSDCYTVLNMDPEHLDTIKMAINSLILLKKPREAIAMIDRALALTPKNENISLLYAKANLLKNIRLFDQSLETFNQLLAQQPDHVSALIDRGNVYGDLEKFNNALDDFNHVLKLEPQNKAAWINKAYMFNQGRFHSKAAECYRQVIPLLPDDAGARIALILHMQHMCDWQHMDELVNEFKTILAAPDYLESAQLCGAMPSVLLSIPNITPKEHLLFAQRYTRMVTSETPPRTFHTHAPNQKIHVGYFSVDFNQHPVSQLMVEVLELHNREQFIISAYSTKASDNSPLRKRVEKSVDHFIDVSQMSDADVVEKIMADKVDILIDLSGYTINSRSALLALRPAPIQVNYLGFLGTMGADFIDYIIADDFLIPPSSEQFYHEKVVRLPSYQANDRQCVTGETPSRASVGLPDDVIVFCCFNINYKITPDVFSVWCKLLKDIPDSVLWLFAGTDEAEANLKNEAVKYGINPERLVFAPWLVIDQHLLRIACADLFLDTAPYNAGTTASNALWAGVPVITCAGQTFSSRMAGSLLTALNVPELITHSLDDYYNLAFELATQHEKRNALRQKIMTNKDTALLFDSARFTVSLENAYRTMLDDYLK